MVMTRPPAYHPGNFLMKNMNPTNSGLIKVGVVDLDVRVSSYLKEELTWAVDKQLWVISTIMLFKNSKSTKELKEIKE